MVSHTEVNKLFQSILDYEINFLVLHNSDSTQQKTIFPKERVTLFIKRKQLYFLFILYCVLLFFLYVLSYWWWGPGDLNHRLLYATATRNQFVLIVSSIVVFKICGGHKKHILLVLYNQPFILV